jgi:uncharacterized membrane protein
MATVLETTSNLEIVGEDFTLLSQYSGQQNINLFFDVVFTVLDNSNPIQGASIIIGLETFITDVNGQVTVSLIRGDYIADVTADGYETEQGIFTVIDENINIEVDLVNIGSFAQSEFDVSYEQ